MRTRKVATGPNVVPQPGRVNALLQLDRDFQALNPKFGAN